MKAGFWTMMVALGAVSCGGSRTESNAAPGPAESALSNAAAPTPSAAAPAEATPTSAATPPVAAKPVAEPAAPSPARTATAAQSAPAASVSLKNMRMRSPLKASEELHFDPVVGDCPSTQKHDAALARGRKALAKKDFDAAISAYEEALSYDGESAMTRGELGYAISLATTDGSGTDILRSAEAIAMEPLVRSAIAYNLVKAYTDSKEPELAERAKRRAAVVRKGATTGPSDAGDSSCPVRVVPSHEIERTNWLGAYAKIVNGQAADWGIETPPETPAQARAASCWRSSGSVQDSPSRSKECEGQMPWQVTTMHVASYADQTYFVWPLGRDDVAIYSTILGGSMCSMEQSSSNASGEGKRVGDFLLVTLADDEFTWVGSTSQCVMASRTHSVELYDIALKRGFRIDGLNADVTVGLVPKDHVLTFTGATCDEYVDLKTAPAP